MLRFVSVILVMACLLGLSACRQAAPTPMLEVQDQSIEDGKTTITLKAAIDKAGWLVLHPATAEGEADSDTTLAFTYLASSGEYEDIAMMLSAVFVGETTVYAMLHYDEPADKQFIATADPPVTVEDAIVEASFTISGVAPYVEVQDIQGSTLTANAAIDKAGWLAIYPSTPEGDPDTSRLIGLAHFQASGNYADISLDMIGTIADGDTIYAMLHHDDPADDEFTFTPDGDEDPPVEVSDSVVTDSFEVGD